jgi:hypothetical protein
MCLSPTVESTALFLKNVNQLVLLEPPISGYGMEPRRLYFRKFSTSKPPNDSYTQLTLDNIKIVLYLSSIR